MVTKAGQRGVTYLALLIVVALVSGVLAASATIVSQAQQRERERQLLWAGDQIRRAIVAYSQQAADAEGGAYPRELSDLLEDTRFPTKRRYLRRVYYDPMTNTLDWGLVRNAQNGIIGIFSRSPLAPIKIGNFPDIYRSFEQAETYADWAFVVSNPASSPAADQSHAPAAPTPTNPPATSPTF